MCVSYTICTALEIKYVGKPLKFILSWTFNIQRLSSVLKINRTLYVYMHMHTFIILGTSI
jgi:hypothetical protein